MATADTTVYALLGLTFFAGLALILHVCTIVKCKKHTKNISKWIRLQLALESLSTHLYGAVTKYSLPNETDVDYNNGCVS